MQIDYYHFDTLPSTNSFVKENLPLFPPDRFSVVTTDRQTHGRGRRDRGWTSEPGNLFMTLAFYTHEKQLGSFGIQLALACCELLKAYDPKIKWPNHILIHGKKVAGILGETVFENEGTWVILGIGVNLNQMVKVENAVSLSELTKKRTDLKEFTESLAESFPASLDLLPKYAVHKKGDLLKMDTGGGTVEGTFLRFGAEGELILDVRGKEIALFSGEIL